MLLASVSAILALTIGGTLAFLQSTYAVTNVMTIGNVEIEIEEVWDEDDADDLVPGEWKVKMPWVNNTGTNDAYVRMYLTGNWEDFVYFDWDNITTDATEWGPANPWLLVDGYFYYHRAILGGQNPNDATTPLFTRVTVREDLTEATILPDRVELVVNAHAIQAGGLFNSDGSPVDNAIDAFAAWVYR
jgi:hypothetical protein